MGASELVGGATAKPLPAVAAPGGGGGSGSYPGASAGTGEALAVVLLGTVLVGGVFRPFRRGSTPPAGTVYGCTLGMMPGCAGAPIVPGAPGAAW